MRTSKMRGFARWHGGLSSNILLLAFLQFFLMSQLSTPVNASRYHSNEVLEFQRSMARFRQLPEHRESMRELFQVNENENSQARKKQDLVDGFQVEQEVVVQKEEILERPVDGTSNENSKLEKNEDLNEQQGNEHTVADEESKEQEQQQGEEKKAEEQAMEDEQPFIFPEPYLLGPTIKDWDEQRGRWLDANPAMKSTADGKPRVLIVTGSQREPCRAPEGDNFHLKSLKIKIDYARMHNYEIYYNFVWLDPLFGSYWVKLPTIRKLMLTHPEIEWFLWVDSDATFTDMLFEPPLHTYEGYNFLMWGQEYGLYTRKSWTSYNAGVFLIRNCQWSLDLIDKWSPMGPKSLSMEYGKLLSTVLLDRGIEHLPADDQSALGYLILTDEDVKAKVKLIVSTDYQFSGWWIPVVETFEECMEKYHPGIGNEKYPWITHFTGCGPCNADHNTAEYEKCIDGFNKAYYFADNQVLAYMGFQHESLSSPVVLRTRNETNRPLDFVGVNPWEERMAQLAAVEQTSS